MNLREIAKKDNEHLLEDTTAGWGVEIFLYEPVDGGEVEHRVIGQFVRVSTDVDPDTGLVVVAPRASITIRLGSTPNIPKEGWRVVVHDNAFEGRVNKILPDYTADRLTLLLRS